MPELIGCIGKDLPELHQWVQAQPLSALLRSNYARGRLECYYGLAVTLTKTPEIYPGLSDLRVAALGDRLLPGWHSALLCQYPPGVGINPHRDHSCFAKLAVMVNIGEANFFEYPGRDRIVTPLVDGAIVQLDTKILHGVEPVAKTRYSLTFRHIKGEYLTGSVFVSAKS